MAAIRPSRSCEPTRLGASFSRAPAVRLMAGDAEVLVELGAGGEPLLLLGRQRRRLDDRRRGLARPVEPADDPLGQRDRSRFAAAATSCVSAVGSAGSETDARRAARTAAPRPPPRPPPRPAGRCRAPAAAPSAARPARPHPIARASELLHAGERRRSGRWRAGEHRRPHPARAPRVRACSEPVQRRPPRCPRRPLTVASTQDRIAAVARQHGDAPRSRRAAVRQLADRRRQLTAHGPARVVHQREHRRGERLVRLGEPALGQPDRRRAHVGRLVRERALRPAPARARRGRRASTARAASCASPALRRELASTAARPTSRRAAPAAAARCRATSRSDATASAPAAPGSPSTARAPGRAASCRARSARCARA